jgi:hypothetical protein
MQNPYGMVVRLLVLASFMHTCSFMLLPRPVYPPAAVAQITSPIRLCSSFKDDMPLLLHSAHTTPSPCSCDDVFVLQRCVEKLQVLNLDLTRRVLRQELLLSELLESMQASDDVALLERKTCSAVVYNENLTSPRKLRLLREELKRLQLKFST